jgi:hypothetical protein
MNTISFFLTPYPGSVYAREKWKRIATWRDQIFPILNQKYAVLNDSARLSKNMLNANQALIMEFHINRRFSELLGSFANTKLPRKKEIAAAVIEAIVIKYMSKTAC